MHQLVFEYVSDVRAAHPYYCVYTSEEMSKYQRNPFLEIVVEKAGNLVFTIEARQNVLHLTPEQWEEILTRGRAYHNEILESGEDW
jgi:hypothetical protein